MKNASNKPEKEGLFQIGQVAKMFHLSVPTLRHYEKIGLLQPEYIDPNSGYRYYSTRQFEPLNYIRYLRALDMPLEQIQGFLKNRNLETIQTMLKEQKEALILKQQELKMIEQKIDNRLQVLEDALSASLNEITLEMAEPVRISWMSQHISLHSYLDLEESIRQLENQNQMPVVFFGKIGVGISQDHLLQKEYSSYDSVFLILDEEDNYQGNTELWPAQLCASISFCGTHAQAKEYYELLADYIEEHHLKIAASSREITVIDDSLTSDPSRFRTQIQIPVCYEKGPA